MSRGPGDRIARRTCEGDCNHETGPLPHDHQETNMESVYRSVAGIDVDKKMLAVVVRSAALASRPHTRSGNSATTRAEIQHLEAWLRGQGVSEVVMESTAQYWRPVWYGLEPHVPAALDPPVKDASTARAEIGFPRCAAKRASFQVRAEGLAPPNERTLVRKFKRPVKGFGSLGLDVRALLDQQLPAAS